MSISGNYTHPTICKQMEQYSNRGSCSNSDLDEKFVFVFATVIFNFTLLTISINHLYFTICLLKDIFFLLSTFNNRNSQTDVTLLQIKVKLEQKSKAKYLTTTNISAF